MDHMEIRRGMILGLLQDGDLRGVEIAERLLVKEGRISEDLSALKQQGVLFCYRSGKFMHWTLDAKKLQALKVDEAAAEKQRTRQKAHNMQLTYDCIARGVNTAMDVFTELRGRPGIKTIGSINIYIRALLKDSRIKRGQPLRITSKIERATYEPTRYQYDGQFKDQLGTQAMLMMGINPYPHKPGKPVEVQSHSQPAITYKPGRSYGVADYGGF